MNKTDIIYGYGFEINVANDILVSFVKKHMATIKQIANRGNTDMVSLATYIELGNTDIKTVFVDTEDISSCQTGVYAIVSNVINEETGVRVEFQEDNTARNTVSYIMFPECLPWELNSKEKTLTEATLCSILKNYMNELWIKGEPKFVECAQQ